MLSTILVLYRTVLLCCPAQSFSRSLQVALLCSMDNLDSVHCIVRKTLCAVSVRICVCACRETICFCFCFNFINVFYLSESTEIPSYVSNCPSNGLCSRLPPDCMTCNTNYSCVYGKPATFDCKVKPHVHCVVSNLLLLNTIFSNLIQVWQVVIHVNNF